MGVRTYLHVHALRLPLWKVVMPHFTSVSLVRRLNQSDLEFHLSSRGSCAEMLLKFRQQMAFRLRNRSLRLVLLTTSQLCWRAVFTLMSWIINEPTNVGSLLFSTNYWTSVLMHGWIWIFVTRLFVDLFRLFQYCSCNYHTNGARVRATGIVGILTWWGLYCVKITYHLFLIITSLICYHYYLLSKSIG